MTHTFHRIKHRLWWLLAPPVVSSVLTSWMAVQMVSLGSQVDRIDRARASLGALLSSLKDAETGQRGYLLTGDALDLDPYHAALQALPQNWARLDDAVRAGIMDAQAVSSLHGEADRKLREIAQTIDLYGAGDRQGALALVASGTGRSTMDVIRASAGGMFRRLDAPMQQKRGEATQYRNAFFILGVISVALSIVGLSALFALVRRYGEIRDEQDEQLRQMNLTLEEKVAARTAELGAANRDLAEFARIAAHDLNAPLRTSSMLLDLFRLRYAAAAGPEGADLLERAHRSIGTLQTLLASLLAYVRAGGAPDTPVEPVPLRDAVNAAIANLQQPLGLSHGQISVCDLPTVEGHAPLLTLVFQNLIENSIKYRRAGAPLRVEIAAQPAGEQAIVTVKDNGIGFESEFKESIFQPFTRLHDQEQYPGSGIGLATCARIVERHGGSIWAESAMGQGSTFFVKLPLGKGGARRAAGAGAR